MDLRVVGGSRGCRRWTGAGGGEVGMQERGSLIKIVGFKFAIDKKMPIGGAELTRLDRRLNGTTTFYGGVGCPPSSDIRDRDQDTYAHAKTGFVPNKEQEHGPLSYLGSLFSPMYAVLTQSVLPSRRKHR
jgi:hypothetical protein